MLARVDDALGRWQRLPKPILRAKLGAASGTVTLIANAALDAFRVSATVSKSRGEWGQAVTLLVR